MIRRPPRSTRTDTLFPYTTLFRSMRTGATPIAILIRTDSFRLALGVSARRGQPPRDQVFRVSGDTSPLILRRAVIRRGRGVGRGWNGHGVWPVKRWNTGMKWVWSYTSSPKKSGQSTPSQESLEAILCTRELGPVGCGGNQIIR